MNVKIFSYKVDGVVLEPESDQLKISKIFDRKATLDTLKEVLKTEKYIVDETSLSYKIKDDQLYIEGLAVEEKEPKTVGFRFGK